MNYLRVRARRAFIHSSMLCTSLLCNNCSLLQLVEPPEGARALSISILFLPSRESMDKCAKCHCHANCAGECISCQITEQGRLIRECRHRREVPCPQTLHKHLIQRRGNGTAPHAEGPGVWYNTWECTITPRWEELCTSGVVGDHKICTVLEYGETVKYIVIVDFA